MTFRQDGPLDMRDEHRFSTLDAAFERAISPWEKPETPVTLLFSGGVDSGLLAWALRHHPGLTLITVGVRGSPDLRAAEESAALIGTRWVSSEITAPEVRELADRTRADTVDLPRTTRNVLIAFALALDRAPRTPILCGQGVDELFLGYAHFHGLGPAEAAKRSQADLRVLLERDWPRSQQIARRTGRTVVAPYLHPEFVAAAGEVPIERRMSEPVPKGFFREWAMRRGLPAVIATRPKRALQYGSGVDRLVPEEARGNPGPR